VVPLRAARPGARREGGAQRAGRGGSGRTHGALSRGGRAGGGVNGCAGRVAGEFGEYPETAAARMAWALEMIRSAYEDLASREFAYAG
jgi:hypothetical protein